MFALGIFLAAYSYTIFSLGLLGLLQKNIILVTTFVFLFTLTLSFYKKIQLRRISESFYSFTWSQKITLLTIVIISVINVIGALGPELAFDALWYHLTFPKIFLQHGRIIFIPGGLLYYSAMPKLGEMLYVGALALGNEITAKILHFIFGLFVCLATYKTGRVVLSKKIALLAVLIFYSNLVVAWESTTAYVDLIRTFYEVLAFYSFLLWYKKQKAIFLSFCGLFVGCAIATKLLAFGSLAIFILLLVIAGYYKKKTLKAFVYDLSILIFFSLLVPLPWFLFSFFSTGSFVYPFFTPIYPSSISSSLLQPSRFFYDLYNIFLHAADPISPVYIILLPLIFYLFSKMKMEIRLMFFYSFSALIAWYISPRTGGGRFFLPYLPVFSLLCAWILTSLQSKLLVRTLVFVIFLVSFITIGYRAVANVRYLPVIFGKESKSKFLQKNLHFSYGDFYDVDDYFSKTLKAKGVVLLYGFHNLYYVNIPYIDSSWVKRGDKFRFISVQKEKLPARFSDWTKIYYNKQTNVAVYEKGGRVWVY